MASFFAPCCIIYSKQYVSISYPNPTATWRLESDIESYGVYVNLVSAFGTVN